jgi:MarR family transcriptional regulator, lower aerobic nicotinate degradation pathway regulator
MSTIAKASRKPQQLKSKPIKATAVKAPVKAVARSTSKPAASKAAVAKSAPVAAKSAPAGTNPARSGYVLEDQIGFHLRRAHQRATGIFNDVMGQFDVTPTQFAALAKIDELGAVSQTFLGRLTGMDAATILGVVGRLLRQGLIIARAEPGDMRMTVLELSPKGRLSIDGMKKVAATVTEKTLAPLSAAEAKTLSQLLAKLM